MMAYQQKNNSGVIFKNKDKEKDTHPDYRGKCVVDGVEKEIALWIKKSEKGTSYFSAAFKEPYKKHAGDSDTGRRSSVADMESDLPF